MLTRYDQDDDQDDDDADVLVFKESGEIFSGRDAARMIKGKLTNRFERSKKLSFFVRIAK